MGLLAIMNAYTMRNSLTVTLTQLVKMRNYTKDEIASEAVCDVEVKPDESHLAKVSCYRS